MRCPCCLLPQEGTVCYRCLSRRVCACGEVLSCSCGFALSKHACSESTYWIPAQQSTLGAA